MGRPPGSRNRTKETENMDIETAPAGSNEITVIPPAPKSVITDMANRFHMEPPAFEAALRATVVPKDCSPAQFAAFLMVAKEYNLNPLTKEIYAFPARGGGIVPIVSVDGWVNLINSHGQCDGFSFEMEKDGDKLISCTCTLHRKDRAHPVEVTEYYAECARQTEPWKMKHRMLRHKALIQAARYAFGFSGIYDEDEGEKIAAIDPDHKTAQPPRTVPGAAEPPKEIAPPAEQQDQEQARDGTPPPRQPKAAPKEDPISTGGPPRASVLKGYAVDESAISAGPSDPGPKPHRVPGDGHTFETWAEKYCDLIQTSPDIATLYKWIDDNSKEFSPGEGKPMQIGPLTRLNKFKPSVYATVKATTEKTMAKLRAEQEKASTKATKKAEAAAPPPSDMDEAGHGDMMGDHQDQDGAAEEGPPDTDPESILKWVKAQLATVTDPDRLEPFYNESIAPHIDQLFPPDQDLIAGYYREAEKRLGID